MCMLFHSWSKWKDIRTGDVLRTKDKAVIGSCIEQERECLICGKKQLNLIEKFFKENGKI